MKPWPAAIPTGIPVRQNRTAIKPVIRSRNTETESAVDQGRKPVTRRGSRFVPFRGRVENGNKKHHGFS